jgi:hypothetical protein
MSMAQAINDSVLELPEPEQAEVLDFAKFLQQKVARKKQQPQPPSPAGIDEATAEALRAAREYSGKFGAAYYPGYLEEIREGWPE